MKLRRLWGADKAGYEMPPEQRFYDGRLVFDVLDECSLSSADQVVLLSPREILSLRVDVDGKRYKVAECVDIQRAELAERALRLVSDEGGPVPRFVARSATVIVVEWVEGEPLKSRGVNEQHRALLECQTALFNTSVTSSADGELKRFVHAHHLDARFRRMGQSLFSEEDINQILCEVWRRLPEPEPVHVIHPDLTAKNVVLSERGPIIIDNEAIALGVGREFDVWHTAESLYTKRASMAAYVRDYDAMSPGSTVFSHATVWDDLRKLRRILKAIEKRKKWKARRLFRGMR